MKIAPLFHALSSTGWAEPVIVHTGQHYDANMSDHFFRDLKLPSPHFHLGVGSGDHGETTGKVMQEYEAVAIAERPDWIIVVGDVNPTAACTMVGVKLGITVAHLEAGLRSGDRTMPEEINRIVTDSIADVLWTPSPDGDKNLLREGVDPARVTRVGNIMMDSYELMRGAIETANTATSLSLGGQDYAVVTLHRPSNVDNREILTLLVDQLVAASKVLHLVFPVHPRTRKQLRNFGLWDRLLTGQVHLLDPLGYIDFMGLVRTSTLAVTDSGGLQEETTYLGIPCITLRPNTERPATITEGTNQLATAENLLEMVQLAYGGDWQRGRRPDLWDGKTARRIVADISRRARGAKEEVDLVQVRAQR